MNLINYYWYFNSALTPKFCDDVIAYAKKQKEVMAVTGGFGDKELNKEEIKNLKRKRNSDLVWLNDAWIYRELHPYVNLANKLAGWNFDWERSSKHRVQCKEILSKGSIIVFPSFVWHRVKPVTSGTRYSLVVWHLGRPFR
jgi:PKHD-type hydroxylase